MRKKLLIFQLVFAIRKEYDIIMYILVQIWTLKKFLCSNSYDLSHLVFLHPKLRTIFGEKF
jgi:hypothetical protein